MGREEIAPDVVFTPTRVPIPDPLPRYGDVAPMGYTIPSTATVDFTATATCGITLGSNRTIYSFTGTNGSEWSTLVPSQREIMREWNDMARSSWINTTTTSATTTGFTSNWPTIRASASTNMTYDQYLRITQQEESERLRSIADEVIEQDRPRITAAQRDEVELRARNLLLSCLTPEQRAMYEKEFKFRVVSNLGNIFEIHRKRMHGVYKLDMQGNKVEEWCVTPHGRIPIDDVLLSQKVMLETDESGLRREANVWALDQARLGQQLHRAALQYAGYNQPPDYLQGNA